MSYVALYRKFRPQTFAQVKGQEPIVRTLRNQIKNNRIGHAYLFTGTRGTGKTTIAKIFAKAVNCLNPHDGEPCGECEHCKAVINGSFIDIVEIDAASNTGVDDIRRVIDEVRYTPVSGRYKVYIIDEVHMLSTSAANAFLKTLEEPPEYVIFILATTDPQKLPATILSRCQRYDFRRITAAEIAGNINEILKSEGIEAEEKAVKYIAQVGDGSMRDSLSLLEKVTAYSMGEKITYEAALQALGTVDSKVFSKIFRFAVAGDAYNAINEFDNAVQSGKAIGQLVNDFIWYMRNLMLMNASGGRETEILGLSDDNLKILAEDSKLVECAVIIRYIEILSSLANSLKTHAAKQAACEIALIKLSKPQMETDILALTDRIRQLEAGAVQNPQISQGSAHVNVGTVGEPKQQPVSVQPKINQEIKHTVVETKEQTKVPEEDNEAADWQRLFDEPAGGAADANNPVGKESTKAEKINIPESNITEASVKDLEKDKNPEESARVSAANTESPVNAETANDVAQAESHKHETEKQLQTDNTQPAQIKNESGYTPSFIVQSNWKEVVEGCHLMLNKKHLEAAEVTPESDDLIRITISNVLGFNMIEKWKDELKELIKKTTGCDISLIIENGQVNIPTIQALAGGAKKAPVQTPAPSPVQEIYEPGPEISGGYEPDAYDEAAYAEERLQQLLKENVMMDIEEEA